MLSEEKRKISSSSVLMMVHFAILLICFIMSCLYNFYVYHSMCEMSRLTVLLLIEQEKPGFVHSLNPLMDDSASCLPRLVQLGQQIPAMEGRVNELVNKVSGLLPDDEAARRFVISLHFCIVVF